MKYRDEHDALGPVRVPADAYYGASTQRALDNFPVSGLRMPPAVIHALAMIKKHAAVVNRGLGLLDAERSDAVTRAAREVQEGRWDDQFVVDVFQTGSGTSTNMNVNEVIAGRANELLTGKRGGTSPVHPNDHVNLGQSSNDTIPSAIHMAACKGIREGLLPALDTLECALRDKSEEFAHVVKIGRTHLQDALPVTLGQEFGGWARQVELAKDRIRDTLPRLSELPLGGTAVGTGVNAPPAFAASVIARIGEETGHPFQEAENHFEAQGARDAAVETSGALRTLAVGLIKVSNDLRWLACGPRAGFNEITLPVLQPGSSIMPGKVNPVIPESVIQAAAQVLGNDLTIAYSGQAGNFELNVMMPVIAYNLIQSIEILGNVADILARRCVRGITANRERCAARIEQSLALATYLVPAIGYDRASALAKEAFEKGETIRQAALRLGVLPPAELERLLAAAQAPPK